MATLTSLPEVADVKEYENIYRLSSHNGPRTTMALLEAARTANATVNSLSVQSTSLDDVFVHYTGHQLRDKLEAPSGANSPYLFPRGQ
jgi:ABC-2 type transport system ATP-binding protein